MTGGTFMSNGIGVLLKKAFSNRKTAALLCIFLAFSLVFFLPSTARAEETVTEGETTSIGEDDVALTQDTVAAPGTATIVEHEQDSENVVDKPEEFTNDAPAAQTETDTGSDTGSGSGTEPVTPQNAIQKAIDAALADIEDNTDSITIDVSAGTYDGDINIVASSVREGVRLYILASDSYTQAADGQLIDKSSINTNSSGGAKVNGNITIEGIDVVLAGLYLSLDKIITVKNANVTVNGTQANDTISTVLDGSDTSVTVNGGEGNDTLKLSASDSAARSAGNAATLNGGAGDDTISVDVSAARSVGSVRADGGAGSDRLHLTGALKQGGESAASLNGSVANIHLQNEGGQTVNMDASSIEQYTDELTNKPEIVINTSDIVNNQFNATNLFTNYLLNQSTITTLTINGSGFLSNLTIKGGDTLTIGTLNAGGLNVTLEAKNITVTGTVQGRNIFITALDDDKNIELSAEDMGLPSDYEYQTSIMDFVSGASIKLAEGANLNASGSVLLTAGSEQTSSLLPVGEGFNFVSVKVGTAEILILGVITAGSTVEAAAKALVNVAASNSSLAKWFIPLAVAVVVAGSSVKVGENASITAGGSVTLTSNADVTMTTASTAGKLPISLAVSVAVVDSHVEVKGNITSNAGSITLKSEGKTSVTTKAEGKAPETKDTTSNPTTGTGGSSGAGGATTGTTGNTFGGFFAFSVVIQDVDAAVKGAASLYALQNISITSNADERVTTKATSAAPEASGDQNGQSQNLSSVLDIVKTILGAAATKLGAQAKAFIGLNKAVQQVAGTDGYKVNAQTTTNGSVTTPAKVKAGEEAAVTVKPNEGYALQALTYTYLPAGQSAQVTKNINISGGGNSFSFVMPDAEVTIVAVFRARTASDPDDLGTGNLFDEEEEDDSQGISDLFDEGTAGTGDETQTGAGTTGAYTVTADTALQNGALIPAAASADAGKEIAITINPTTGYQLQAGSLKATTQLDGRTSIQTLAANAAGEYVLTMPAGNVVLSAIFEQAPAGTTPETGAGAGKSNSSSQVVGAVAVAVVLNNNDAYIDTTGTIRAGGALNLNAVATTQSSTSADGSSIPEDAAEGVGEGTGETPADTTGDVVTQEQQVQGKPVVVSATVNGTVTCVSQGAGTRVAFDIDPRQGYKLTANTLKYSYMDPTTSKLVEAELTLGSGGSYYFDIPAGLPADANITVSAQFEADSHTITLGAGLDGKVIGPVNAKTGDTVTLTVTPGQGNAVTSIKYNTTTITLTDGKYTFTMPGEDITITATFGEKAHDIEIADAVKNYLSASDSKADAGETVTISVTDQAANEGKKLTSLTVTLYNIDAFGEEQELKKLTVTDNKFTLPAASELGEMNFVRITAVFEEKGHAVSIDTTAKTNGNVTAPSRVDSGEKITLVATPNEGYKLKENSLKVKTEDGSVTATVPVTADAQGNFYYTLPTFTSATPVITILAEFITDPDYTGTGTGASAPKKSTFSLGVGVTVAVTSHKNNAYIANGTIQAGSLSISAISGSEDDQLLSSAASKAGYSQGDIGIGGALTVHVATAKTRAVILDGATVYLTDGGDVSVNASSNERFTTSADAVSSDNASKIGVGAGIAIAVIGVDVVACVDDGADIISVTGYTGGVPTEGGKLGSLKITADHASSEAMLAKAGSAGGISITPVLALDISGIYTSAYLGSGRAIKLGGDLAISSSNSVTREVAANAAAAGGSVGVGASFAITVLNDTANAVLRRNARARSVTVRAVSRSSLTSNSRAGSQGSTSRTESSTAASGSSESDGESQQGESDAQADRSIAGGSGLSRRSGSTNTNPDAVSGLTSNRQTSQTSEGNIQIAAAFNLNVLCNRAEAYISGAVVEAYQPEGDSSEEPAAGSVTVQSRNDTDAAIYANASATNARIGVGVAVAINIVSYYNIAHIDDVTVTASSLEVTALIEDPKVTTEETQPEEEEDINIVEALIRQAIDKLVKSLADSMGLGKLLDSSAMDEFLSNLVAELAANAANTLLTGTGLEGILSNDIGQKIEDKLASLGTIGTETASKVKDAVLNKLLGLLSAKVTETFKPADPNAPADTLTPGSALEETATEIANDLFSEIVDVTQLMTFLKGDVAATLKENAMTALSEAGKALTTTALDGLSSWLSLKIEPEDDSPSHTFITQAISGAGASNVGIAGSAAIAVIIGTTKAYIAGVSGSTVNPIVVTGDTVIKAYARQTENTVASSAVTDKGTADTDPGAGAGGDTGNTTGTPHESTTSGKVVVGSMTNGTMGVSGTQTAGGTVTLTVTPDDGYKIGTKFTATRSDTGATITLTPARTVPIRSLCRLDLRTARQSTSLRHSTKTCIPFTPTRRAAVR